MFTAPVIFIKKRIMEIKYRAANNSLNYKEIHNIRN